MLNRLMNFYDSLRGTLGAEAKTLARQYQISSQMSPFNPTLQLIVVVLKSVFCWFPSLSTQVELISVKIFTTLKESVSKKGTKCK